MGVSASRQFSDEVAACINKGLGLEDLLLNPEVVSKTILHTSLTTTQFVSHCKTFCGTLPAEARQIIQDLGRQINQNPGRQHAQGERGKSYLLKVQQVKATDVGISKGFAPFFKSWTEPEAFFNPCERLGAGSIVSQVYEELRHISKRNVDDPIRLRIYAVALCDLRCLVDENFQSLLRPGIKESIAQIIFDSSIVNDSLEEIMRWVELYVKFGQRMKAIADRNGGLGALIVIPSWLLSLRQWAKELNAADFDKALQHFDNIKVAQKAVETGSHDVANRIHSVIMQKFTSSIHEGSASTPQHVQSAIQEGAMSDKNSTDDEDMLDEDGSSVDSHLNNSDITSSRTSLGVSDQEHSCQVDGGSGDPMIFDELQKSHHSTSAFSNTDISSSARAGLQSTSMQAQMQTWQPSRNDETLPSVEQDDQELGGYSSTSTTQAFPTVLTETATEKVGAEQSQDWGTLNQDGSSQNTLFQELQTPQPFQNPYVQQSESLQTPQPLRNPYILQNENFQAPHPFQNPYILQNEAFQAPHPFQNPYILQNESFQAPQPFQNTDLLQPESFQAPQPSQNPYILQPQSFQAQQSFQESYAPQPETLQISQPLPDASTARYSRTQVLQEHQNAHRSQGGHCGAPPNPHYEPVTIYNTDRIVVDAYG